MCVYFGACNVLCGCILVHVTSYACVFLVHVKFVMSVNGSSFVVIRN